MANKTYQLVWIFRGTNRIPGFPSAVYSTLALAEAWIQEHGLTGTLTRYPVDISVIDWAVTEGHYRIQGTALPPEFIANFSSAALEHYHYEGGKRAGS